MLTIESYLKEQLEQALQALNIPITEFQFDRPKLENHGDLSVNLAMVLARQQKQNPRALAQSIIGAVKLDSRKIARVEMAGPGFINFFIAPEVYQEKVEEILALGAGYGRSQAKKGKKALVEFVSANPTGPLTVGHGRQSVLGDTIARLLEWVGYDVTREYYFNNAGRQMRVLADSVRYRYRELLNEKIEFPEDYYQGDYIRDIARKIYEKHGANLQGSDDLTVFKETAEAEIFRNIKKTLANLGIVFDSFFNEMDLYRDGDIDKVIEALKARNLAYEQEGALWFKATEFGLDQDRVIVKSSGEPTYRLPDIAYHLRKLRRGYHAIVDLFGADHIATYPDVLAGLRALGEDTSAIKVLIHQFVTLTEGDGVIKMSTRKAIYDTLDELVAEVGADVTRWFFLMRSMQSHLNFDLELAKTQSDENPVFYNQYAHARICSILRNAGEKQMAFSGKAEFSMLHDPAEFALIKKLMEFPKLVIKCALDFEPHLLTQFLSEVSMAFHKFYTECRVIDPAEPKLTDARLGVCLATRQVLANGFQILNITAPQRM